MNTKKFNHKVFLELKYLFSNLQLAADFFQAQSLSSVLIKDWLSGKHVFSYSEIRMIENYFALNFIRTSGIDRVSSKEKLHNTNSVAVTSEQLRDIIHQAVLQAGEPVLLKNIYYTIRDSHPDFKWIRMQIHLALLKDDRIGCFQEKGNEWYYIKEYEHNWKLKKEKVHRLVCDFINEQPGPVHLDEILKFVARYHQIDKSTLRLIIKVDLKGKCFQVGSGYYDIRARKIISGRER